MEEPIIIGEFEKNDSELIRVAVDWYKNKPQLDLRVWWRRDPDDEWKRGKKGLTLQLTNASYEDSKKYHKLIELLKKAEPVVKKAIGQLKEERAKFDNSH